MKTSKRIDVRKTGDKSCLVIDHVTPSDQDSYTCAVTTKKGVSETTVFLEVSPKASERRFNQEMNNVDITPGGDAKFDVRIEGVDLEVDWYRDDELIEDAGRFIIEDPHPDRDDNLYSLTIEDVRPEDAGLYKCVAKWDGEVIVTTAALCVSSTDVAAPGEDMDDEVLEVGEGDRLQLELVVTGAPGAKINWYKNDKLIRSDGNYNIKANGDEHFMVIEKTTAQDSGTYKCVASGREGTVTREFQVEVRGNLHTYFP